MMRKFIQDEKSYSGKYSKQVFKTLYYSYKTFLTLTVITLICGVVARGLLMFNANLLGYWVDSLCTPSLQTHCKNLPLVLSSWGNNHFLWALIVCAFVGFALNTLFRVSISRIGTRAVGILYNEVTMRTSRFPMRFLDTTPMGRVITRFSSDYSSVFRMAGGPMGEFLCLVFDLVVVLVLVSLASIYFIPLVAIAILVNTFVYKLNQGAMRKERRAVSHMRSPTIAHFSETTQGSRSIKVYGKSTEFKKRFNRLTFDFLAQRMKTMLTLTTFSFQMVLVTSSLFVLTGFYSLYLFTNEYVSVGSIAVAVTFVMMTSSTIQQFFEWLVQVDDALTSTERLDEYLRRPIEEYSALPPTATFPTSHKKLETSYDKETFLKSQPINSEVIFDNVTFKYGEPVILKDLNFKISAGEHVGIVGRTGSGKSSVIQALFALYPLTEGQIFVNGKRASHSFSEDTLPADLFRIQMSLIAQDPPVFKGTLRENLTLRNLPDEAIFQALEEVRLGPWAKSLPGKLNFQIDEKGANVSAGERQLLCLARCLLQNAPVVVMDEATSNIDPKTEEIIIQSTQKRFKNKTRITIAHRISTIESCDRILWINEGRIEMFDTPEKVLKKFRD